ncbi:probable ATP-dependent RNA helicase DDX31 [Haliotis rubra]|uniref:probable ATP-dependent RNA helicase DDX31 n=1 Tax=Haliotis rubra TaxID=36100 RepID=UPI001EE5A2BB|nr:probable ATP-dependent RNA helicase DDX31 [Haliotis rubra]
MFHKVRRIKGRRRLKSKQKKEFAESKTEEKVDAGDTIDGGVAGYESADTREAVATPQTGDGHSRKRKQKGDNVGNTTKKTKSGHGGQVVSSLFRYNPDIPKVVSSKVTELKEDVFSSDSFSHLSLNPFMVRLSLPC